MGGRLFTVSFVALTLSDLAYFTASGLLIGVTPFFVTGPLGSSTAGLGLALGAFSVTTLVLRPVVGRMADRSGRRRLLLVGAGLYAVMIAAHLLVHQLWVLIVVRLLLGVAESLYFVAGFAALADLAPPGRAGEALSWNSVALYLGIAVGPGIGQLLVEWRGFAAAWVGGALLALLAALLILPVPETRQAAPDDEAPAPLIHRAVIRPGLALFAGVAAAAGFLALVGLWATEIGFEAWSVVPLVYGGIVIGCRIIFARVPDRLPPLRLGAGALAACAAGLSSWPGCRVRRACWWALPCSVSVSRSSRRRSSLPSSASSRRTSAVPPRGRQPCSSTWASAAAPCSWGSSPPAAASRSPSPALQPWPQPQCRCSSPQPATNHVGDQHRWLGDPWRCPPTCSSVPSSDRVSSSDGT